VIPPAKGKACQISKVKLTYETYASPQVSDAEGLNNSSVYVFVVFIIYLFILVVLEFVLRALHL
jgi:hypothetical protein